MPSLVHSFSRRDGSSNPGGISSSTLNLLIALLVLVFLSLLLLGGLYTLRRMRERRRDEELPLYHENPSDMKNPHGLTISTPPYYSYSDEKSPMTSSSRSSPKSPTTPTSPVPEIRITFPDETDETGRPKSGRVVVVRISETGGVGLEPLQDEEQLPAYEKEAKDGQKFQSIDMNSIGGLKEKSEWN